MGRPTDNERPRRPDQAQPDPGSDGFEVYESVAETVGGVPSLRLGDNVVQAVIVVLGTAVGALVGLAWLARFQTLGKIEGVLLGALGGLIASVLISGIVLMVIGWVRAARKLSRPRPQPPADDD
ncbi:MAG: hypothetical protein ACODAJ_16365 [Planctomycetota bacterium]